MVKRMPTALRVLVLALALGAVAPAWAAGPPSRELGEAWVPVDPQRLDDIRGGFQLPGGPLISFGIERLVHVNGHLVAHVSVQIPDLVHITPEQALALAEFQRGTVVQIGDGNVVMPGSGAGGLVIQNTRDNQAISGLTRLNVSVDTLGLYKSINLNDTLSGAMIGALRP